jgi:hypothetical protein
MTARSVTKPMLAAIMASSTGSSRGKWDAYATMGRLPFAGKRRRPGLVPSRADDVGVERPTRAGALPSGEAQSPAMPRPDPTPDQPHPVREPPEEPAHGPPEDPPRPPGEEPFPELPEKPVYDPPPGPLVPGRPGDPGDPGGRPPTM